MTWGDPGPCEEPGCGAVSDSRGYCKRHYQLHRRHGDFVTKRFMPSRAPSLTKPSAVCEVCGRAFGEHAVTEFCELIQRSVAI